MRSSEKWLNGSSLVVPPFTYGEIRSAPTAPPPARCAGDRFEGIVGKQRLAAARARVGEFPCRLRLVDGDHEQSVFLVGLRREDLRHHLRQQRARRREAGRRAGGARRRVAVVAAVGDDVGEIRRLLRSRQVGLQSFEADIVGRTRGRAHDRFEVHERVAKRRIRSRARGLRGRRIGLRERRMRARALLRAGFIDALHIRAPTQMLGLQLSGERLRRGRVYAASAEHLFVGAGAGRRDRGVVRAVGDRFDGRPLTAQQRDLVGELLVRDPVVARQKLSLVLERLRHVRRRRARAEYRRVGLVGEHYHEHMLDRRQLRRR